MNTCSCSNCKHALEVQTTQAPFRAVLCRRFPPVFVLGPESGWQFPMMQPEGLCGEHEPKLVMQ